MGRNDVSTLAKLRKTISPRSSRQGLWFVPFVVVIAGTTGIEMRWHDLRHFDGMSVFAQCHERVIGPVAFAARLGARVFGPHVELHFHRGGERAVHLALDDDNLRLANRPLELHAIDRGGHAHLVGVPLRRDRCTLVHQV